MKKHKLVVAWVDLDGIELTGRYRDALHTLPETVAVPRPKAACWGDDIPHFRNRLVAHVAQEAGDHLWIGFFLLPDNDAMLPTARKMALEAYQKVTIAAKAVAS